MTIAPTIEVFQKAAEFRLKLGVEPPDTLTFHPANRCPVEFAITLRAHKAQLLTLLRLPFGMVFSQILEETIFFCEDEATKAALVEAGADSSRSTQRTNCEFSWRRTASRPSRKSSSESFTRSNGPSTPGLRHNEN